MNTHFLKSPLFDLFKINSLLYLNDIIEHPDSYTIDLDMTGYCRDEISIEIIGSRLTVQSFKSQINRNNQNYRKIFNLSTPVQSDKIFANLNECRLEIFIPKAEKPYRIEVNEILIPQNDYKHDQSLEELASYDPY